MGAIVHCIEKWQCYLEGAKFPPRVLTDHKSLQYFNTQAHLFQRQAGWVKRLSPYQLRIEYKPGSKLVTANALSRLYVESVTGDDNLDPNWPLLYLRPEKVRYENINSRTILKLKDNESQFLTDGGNMCCQSKTGKKTPYVPTSQRGDTILHYHQTLGHDRGRNLYEIMKCKVWWPRMRQDILDLLQLCVVCEKNAPTPAPVKSVLPVEAMGPFKQWALDIVGPLPEDKAGKRFIITAIDYFTR